MTHSTAHEATSSRRRIRRRTPLRLLLAEDIDSVIKEIDAHRTSLSASIPVQRRAVKQARTELNALAIQLRNNSAVSPRGLNLTKALLTDVSGPLYTPAPGDALAEAAREARTALCRGAGR